MMDAIEQILQLLQEKGQLFLQYEQETEEMFTCQDDLLEEKMGNRQKIIGKIDKLNEKIREAGAGSEESQALREALNLSCERSQLPERLWQIYDRSMQIRSVIRRLEEADRQAEMRLVQTKDDLLLQIRSTNKGQAAQAAKYYNSMRGGKETEFRFGKA